MLHLFAFWGYKNIYVESGSFAVSWLYYFCFLLFNPFSSALDLQGADFSNANPKSCDFSKADLRSANFSNASLDDASFIGAKLEAADFNRATFYAKIFSEWEKPEN